MVTVRVFGILALIIAGLYGLIISMALMVGRGYDGDELIYVHGNQLSTSLRAYDIAHNLSVQRSPVGWSAIYGVPSWSADGQTLAFMATPFNQGNIYFLDTDSNEVRSSKALLTDNAQSVAWSPDKRYIAYTKRSAGQYQILYVGDFTTGLSRQITVDTTNAFAPTWSADGRKLAFSWSPVANQEIYVIAANETEVPVSNADRLQRLTFDYNNDTMPAWSPDNRWIAFVSDRDGNSEIYVMDTRGENIRRLTHDPTRDTEPQWSPDGRWIVYASIRQNQWELFIIETRCALMPDLSDDCTPRTIRLTYNYVDDRGAVWRPRLRD